MDEKEKGCWENLDKSLKNLAWALRLCNKLADNFGEKVSIVASSCIEVEKYMVLIISHRGKSLDNKRKRVGVRGMRDILFGDDARPVSTNDSPVMCKLKDKEEARVFGVRIFERFSEVLRGISNLPRGGFLWIGSSALTKRTQGLFKDASVLLSNFVKSCKSYLGKNKVSDDNLDAKFNEYQKPIIKNIGEQIFDNNPKKIDIKDGDGKPNENFGAEGNNKPNINDNELKNNPKKDDEIMGNPQPQERPNENVGEKIGDNPKKIDVRDGDGKPNENFGAEGNNKPNINDNEFKNNPKKDGNVMGDPQSQERPNENVGEQILGNDPKKSVGEEAKMINDMTIEKFRELKQKVKKMREKGNKKRAIEMKRKEEEEKREEEKRKREEEKRKREMENERLLLEKKRKREILDGLLDAFDSDMCLKIGNFRLFAVTDSHNKVKLFSDYYRGPFRFVCGDKKYEFLICGKVSDEVQSKESGKIVSDKGKFDGPKIIGELNRWSNNGKDVIVVEGTEEYQNERKNRAAIKIGKALRGYHDREKAKRLEWQKEDKEKRELVERLVGYYKNQNSDVANNTLRSWPLVTDYEAIESWGSKKYFGYYEGHFMINREDWEFVGKSDDYRNCTYYIYVYNQKCKNYRTGEDFDGPAIIEKLNKYSGNGKHVIRVDKSEGN